MSRTHTPAAPIRVALVGFGLGGRVFHAPLIAATAGLNLEAIVSRDPERRAQAAALHPSARIVDRMEQLLDPRPVVDLIVISTANSAHAPLARTALHHDVAVVVDKPLATSAPEAEELVALAHARGVPLTVFHNRRFDDDFRTLSAVAHSGRLGTLHRFEARFERWRPIPRNTWRESDNPADGGGVLLDLGSHLVDQALTLLGPADLAYAERRRLRPGSAWAEDDAFLALRHRSGAISHLWMSSMAAQTGPRMRLQGSLAGVTAEGTDPQEAQLAAGMSPHAPGFGARDPALRLSLGAGSKAEAVDGLRGDYPAFYRRVTEALAGEGELPVLPESAIAALRLIDLARSRTP